MVLKDTKKKYPVPRKIASSQFRSINHTLNLNLTKQEGQITQKCSLCQTVKWLQEGSN